MLMERENEEKEILKRKIEFYHSMNLKCHIKIKPIGFVNGKIITPFAEDGQYFLFQDLRGYSPRRIFIEEVFDIKDYEEIVG